MGHDRKKEEKNIEAGGSRINRDYTEKERKAKEQPLSSFLQKKNNPEISQNKSSRRWTQKQRKAEEGAEERRQCRPARASPSFPSPPRSGNRLLAWFQ